MISGSLDNFSILKTALMDKIEQFWIIYQDLIRNIANMV